MYIYVCQDSFDGIFTGVYDAWASKHGHSNVKLVSNKVDNFQLFAEYIDVNPDKEKTAKVVRTVLNTLGYDVYYALCHAIMAIDDGRDKSIDKADAIYRTIVYGLYMNKGHKVMENLSDPNIYKVFKLARSSNVEAHHYLGFLRFKELKNGILAAIIHPKNDILTELANHFGDRLPNEDFIIYDQGRKTAVINKSSKGYVFIDASDINEHMLEDYSESEMLYEELWNGFFESIAIENRKNEHLQMSNIPKRFWKDTVELRDKV